MLVLIHQVRTDQQSVLVNLVRTDVKSVLPKEVLSLLLFRCIPHMHTRKQNGDLTTVSRRAPLFVVFGRTRKSFKKKKMVCATALQG